MDHQTSPATITISWLKLAGIIVFVGIIALGLMNKTTNFIQSVKADNQRAELIEIKRKKDYDDLLLKNRSA